MTQQKNLNLLEQALEEHDVDAAKSLVRQLRAHVSESTQLAAEVLHELRQPLVGIKAYVQMLRDEGTTSIPIPHLLAQVERMELIMSDFARISSDKPPAFEKVNLAQAVRNAQQLFAANSDSARVSIEVDAAPVIEIDGNERLLEQLALNLFLNARDAMSGRGKVKAIVRVEADGVVLYVADWGPGIPRELRPRIFQPYVTTKPRGSGLGLTVCQRIAQDHGGMISLVDAEAVTDKPAPATVFRVLFPRRLDEAPRKKRILVVDDETIIQMVFQDLMGKECEVVVAGTAEEGLAQLKKAPFDLIVSDKNLPGLSGMDLAQQARQLNPMSQVILMTGYPSLVTAQQAMELGLVDYLLKPFDDIREVREKIRKALAASTVDPSAPTTRWVDVFETNPNIGRQLCEALALLGYEGRVFAKPPDGKMDPPPAGTIVSWDYAPAPGQEGVKLAVAHGRGAPFVVLADNLTLETTLSCLRGGASACLPKALHDVRSLCRDISRALKLG